MRAFAVLDAAWGDCGKGAATDLISSHYPEAIVVRHSGGAQAGHTVETPDGRRHVFSHFGSGSFVGCPTYLGPEFVVNPRVFKIEYEELVALGVKPVVFVHPDCFVTMPTDVSFNRLMERKRGSGKHGSVGIGFGETIERCTRGFPLRVGDFIGDRHVPIIAAVLSKWRHSRGEELGLPLCEYVGPLDEWKLYREECQFFMDKVVIATPEETIAHHDVVIFEGAQGLLLDQNFGVVFPYVTRSNTGLTNVIPLCDQLGIDKLKVVYMHRPYMTRHGAGPLSLEELWPSVRDNFHIVDKTNIHGEWQGSLRFAPFHKQLILNAILGDLQDAGCGVDIRYYSGRSCLDQVGILGSTVDLGIEPALFGFGPSRDKYKVEESFIRGT